jgi:hypothetical protein
MFAEQMRAVACQGYNPKLKVFMKKGYANVRFATPVDFCHASIERIDGHKLRFGSNPAAPSQGRRGGMTLESSSRDPRKGFNSDLSRRLRSPSYSKARLSTTVSKVAPGTVMFHFTVQL